MIQLSARAGLQYAVAVAFLWAGAIAPAQTFTTLKSFGILTNVSGFNPTTQLVQGPDGTPYGTTTQGEGHVGGTVFKVQPDGSGFTALKWFTNSLEGANHQAGLTLSGSTLFGTTREGGSLGLGSVFRLDLSSPLTIQSLGNAVVLSWTDPALALQAAPAASGRYTNIPEATSPYTNVMTGMQSYFRLLGN